MDDRARTIRVSGRAFSAAEITFENPHVSFLQDVESDLYLRIRDVGERVAALQQSGAGRTLANPGFELPPDAATPLPGWELRERGGATVELDPQQKYAGGQSLRFTATQAGASLAAPPFVPMGSGHLSVLVWLRVADPAHQPPLRLAVGGRWKGKDYYRYASVGAGTEQAIGAEWTQYAFEVRDLPTDQITDLRVRLDMPGAGEVWLDEVELREFDEQEILDLKKMITLASYMLERKQLGDCLRLLDGYWPRFLTANVPLALRTMACASARCRSRATCLRRPTAAKPSPASWNACGGRCRHLLR